MTLRRTLKALAQSVAAVLLLGLLGLLGANVLVLRIGRDRIAKSIEQLPLGATGLVLGTSPRSAGGGRR